MKCFLRLNEHLLKNGNNLRQYNQVLQENANKYNSFLVIILSNFGKAFAFFFANQIENYPTNLS